MQVFVSIAQRYGGWDEVIGVYSSARTASADLRRMGYRYSVSRRMWSLPVDRKDELSNPNARIIAMDVKNPKLADK